MNSSSNSTMTSISNKAFVPLRKFWCDYLIILMGAYPSARVPDEVRGILDQIFGKLTIHKITQVRNLPVDVICKNCRNNTGDHITAVCETHIGALLGTLQSMFVVPLEIEYEPVPGDVCRIRVDVQSTTGTDRETKVAYALKCSHVRLQRDAVIDTKYRLTIPAKPEVLRVLQLTEKERTVEELSRMSYIDVFSVAQILNSCYQLGWVECILSPQKITYTI